MDTTTKIDLEKADNQMISYLEMLLEKKGMKDMPPEILSNMLMDLYPRFEKFLFVSVMQNMSKEGFEKFDAFIESNPDPEKSMQFLEENVENFPEVVRNAMDEFEKIYLGEKKTDLKI